MALSNLHFFPPHSAPPDPHKTARGRAPTAPVPPHVESPRLSTSYKYLRVLEYLSSVRHSALSALTARSAEAQMLDLLRPVTQLARPLRPTGGHDFARGSLGLKRGVGAASGGASCAAPTKM